MTLTTPKIKTDVSSLLYDPGQSAAALLKFLNTSVGESLVTWEIPALDNEINAMQPGEILGVIARPGHGKTAMSIYLAKTTAMKLAGDPERREAVVYVTYDESIEQIEALLNASRDTFSITDLMRGEVPLDRVENILLQRHKLPIWVMGESITDWRGTVRMTVDNVYAALRSMERDYGHKPALVIFDYIQIVPVESGGERSKQVNEAVVQAKALARAIKAPIVICVQAARRVDGTEDQLPTAQDCQWASGIEQVANKLISLMRPYLANPERETIKINKVEYRNTYDLLLARLLKQKGGGAGKRFALRMSPQFCALEDMQARGSAPEEPEAEGIGEPILE